MLCIQIPCDPDARRIAADYSAFGLVLRVAGPAGALHAPLVVSFGDFARLQPQPGAAGAAGVELEALAVHLDHSGRREARVREHLVGAALLVEVLDDARAAADAVERDAVDGGPRREVEHDHLVEVARALRADAVTGLLLGEVQPPLGARVRHARRGIGEELARLARAAREQAEALAVRPADVALLAVAGRPRALLGRVRNGEDVAARAGAGRAWNTNETRLQSWCGDER